LTWLDILSAVSIGFYLALLASIAVLALAYMNRTAGDTLQRGFDALKGGFSNHPTETRADAGTTKVVNPTNDPSKPVL
jgi:hypothetical protein